MKNTSQPPVNNRARRRAQEASARKASVQDSNKRAVTQAMRVHLPVLVEEVHGKVSAFMEEQTAASERKPRCKKGCSACCEQLVLLTVGEAVNILRRYPAVVAERIQALTHQAAIAHQTFDGQHCDPSTPAGAQALEVITELWWEKRVPCVFLDRDGTCSIYEHRPISCRQHWVASDPELCAVRTSEDEAPLVLDVIAIRHTGYEDLREHETKFMRDMFLGPMPSMLLTTRANLQKWGSRGKTQKR